MKKKAILILALYPNARGFGYACIEMPQNLMDNGVITVRPLFNDKILERIGKFAEFYKPAVIIVQDSDRLYANGKRVTEVLESIVKYSKDKQIPVYRYSRQQIREVFELFGAKSKYEIANQIIHWFPQLKSQAPKIRKPWMDEDHNMGVFDALALAITHLYLTE